MEQQKKLCPNCQKVLDGETNFRFCPECGQNLNPKVPRTIDTEVRDYEGLIKVYPKASLGKRLLAAFIDALIMSLPIVPGLAAGLGILFNAVNHYGYWNNGQTVTGITIGFLLTFVAGIWSIFYGFTKDGWGNGQSLGKKAVGLMVVELRKNSPCTKGQSAIRHLLIVLLYLLPVVGWLIEPILILANDKGRRLGDMAASTQVIQVEAYRTDL